MGVSTTYRKADTDRWEVCKRGKDRPGRRKQIDRKLSRAERAAYPTTPMVGKYRDKGANNEPT